MFMKYSIVTRIYTEILINQAVDNFTSSRFRESRLYAMKIPLNQTIKFNPRGLSLLSLSVFTNSCLATWILGFT